MGVFLEVVHVTRYRYAKAVEFGPHRVMCRPRPAHDLRLFRYCLTVSPESHVRWVQDVFSNSVAVVEPRIGADELTIEARMTVHHLGTENLEFPVAAEAEVYPFSYSDEEKLDLAAFLPAQYPDDSAAVKDWMAQFMPQRGVIHTRDLLRNVNEFIRSDFQYAARDAMGTQRPTDTLASRSGTCRDFALLMMEAARSLGLAARFVSGYLYDATLDLPGAAVIDGTTGLQQGRQIESRDAGMSLQGSGATHAWLHIYLPGAGWVPFDPTNTLYGGTDLIRTAFARKPEQCPPISGSWTGSPGDFQGMAVNVQVRRITQDEAIASASMDGGALAEAGLPASTD